MARSTTVQFGFFTPEEAHVMLNTLPLTGDSVGDRISLGRSHVKERCSLCKEEASQQPTTDNKELLPW